MHELKIGHWNSFGVSAPNGQGGGGGWFRTHNTISWDDKRRRIGRLWMRWWRRRWRLRRWRQITRWPFSVWKARWPHNHRGAGGVGGDGGGGGDRTWATRTPAPVRGVVLPETGGASDKPVSWRRRWAAGPVLGPTVGRPRRTRSAGPAAGPPVESTRSSLPLAVLAFPFGYKTKNTNIFFFCDACFCNTFVTMVL